MSDLPHSMFEVDPLRQVELTVEESLDPEAVQAKLVERELQLMVQSDNRGKPCHCPKCGVDFHAGDIPQDAILRGMYPAKCDACGRPNHWKSVMGEVDPRLDRVVAWHCRDCGQSWPRKW